MKNVSKWRNGENGSVAACSPRNEMKNNENISNQSEISANGAVAK
jgi:hypothetical protein